MKILFVASEARPFIASGGLADVAGSLPKALCDLGHECRVVIPLYKNIPQQFREKMEFVRNFNVPLAWRNQYCGVFKIRHQGVVYYFLDNEYYFKRDNLYGYYDDAERFAFFSKAAMEMINYIDFDPDVVHANDWHTALVPVYLNTFYRSIPKYHEIKTVFTIHNIQYQGQYGMEIAWDVLGIPEYQHPVLEYNGCLNMMKAAIMQVNIVNTVSPSYAMEIHDPWFSHGLDPILNIKGDRVIGILNGIDIKDNDPKTDENIFIRIMMQKHIEDKKVNKLELMKEMGLEPDENRMLIGMVSRMASHKGLDLVKYIFHDLMRDNVSVVILGSGEEVYENFSRDAEPLPRQSCCQDWLYSKSFQEDLCRCRCIPDAIQERTLRISTDGSSKIRNPSNCSRNRWTERTASMIWVTRTETALPLRHTTHTICWVQSREQKDCLETNLFGKKQCCQQWSPILVGTNLLATMSTCTR